MKNLIKILSILLLSMFLVTGISSCNHKGDNAGSSKASVGLITKFILIGGLLYIETADGKHYIQGNVGELAGERNTEYITELKEVSFTISNVDHSSNFDYVLTDDGLYAWGDNTYGQIDNRNSEMFVTTPKKVPLTGNVKDVIAYNHNGNDSYSTTVYAITDVGLYAWGDNNSGQVGNGTTGATVSTPTKVLTGNVKDVIVESLGTFKNGTNGNFVTYELVTAITDAGIFSWGYMEKDKIIIKTPKGATFSQLR